MIKILLADDHPVVRKGLKQILQEEFVTATIGEVNDGEQLIRQVMTDNWDVVITDLMMPGRSGLEALEQIKKMKPKLPVLIISIHAEELYALRALKAGASGYLKKDMAPEELVKAITVVLSGKQYITSAVAETLTSVIINDQSKEPHELLSDREFEVFKLLAIGRSVSEISDMLSLSASTISTYKVRILTKMNLKTNADLTMYASKKSLL
jgi:two-component system, NarL family, invasion response regulator UvrY